MVRVTEPDLERLWPTTKISTMIPMGTTTHLVEPLELMPLVVELSAEEVAVVVSSAHVVEGLQTRVGGQ
jgi:hypothetical protein